MIESIVGGLNAGAKYIIPLLLVGIPMYAISVKKIKVYEVFVEGVNEHGADSLYAKIGATMFGSSETTFYVLAVYFGSVGITRSRHALIAGLTADAVGALSAVYICKLLIG